MNTGRSGIEQLRNNYFRAVDYWLIVPILTLTMIGLYVLQRVLKSGYSDYPQNLYKQAGAAVVGIFIALLICLLETHFLKLIGWGMYMFSVLLLMVMPFDGFSMKLLWGADAWMKAPIVGTFQPSELAKIGLILVAAFIFEDISEKKVTVKKGVLYLGIVYAIPLALILVQPDFGTAMVIVFSFICILFIWGLKYRYFFLALSGVIVAIPFVWNFYLEAYQKKRILSLLFAGSDPKAEYNLVQAKNAIASGGLIGNTTGTYVRVPVKESDFIFTAVSEHMGFIGTTAIILLSFFFILRCLYVASQATQKSYSFVVIGLTAGFAFHFIENMGMCVGLLPITGIPLPFISLGGTALLVNFIAVGIILNISMDRNLGQR
ncbi:MAG: FtsW/RodA/SpoVE family cell cycle protein [Eubacteriales bacterium]